VQSLPRLFIASECKWGDTQHLVSSKNSCAIWTKREYTSGGLHAARNYTLSRVGVANIPPFRWLPRQQETGDLRAAWKLEGKKGGAFTCLKG
jgi:hypothetical protein